MTAAWVNAKLSAYAPDKASNFMKLETLLAPPRMSPKRPQTVDEMVNIARQWTAATKGR